MLCIQLKSLKSNLSCKRKRRLRFSESKITSDIHIILYYLPLDGSIKRNNSKWVSEEIKMKKQLLGRKVKQTK